MDERRKAAYRDLLYHSVIAIRSKCSWAESWDSVLFSLGDLLRGRRTAREMYLMADAFHNVALYSARDFDGFDEEKFWRHLANNFTEAGYGSHLEWYQRRFTELLTDKTSPQ